MSFSSPQFLYWTLVKLFLSKAQKQGTKQKLCSLELGSSQGKRPIVAKKKKSHKWKTIYLRMHKDQIHYLSYSD